MRGVYFALKRRGLRVTFRKETGLSLHSAGIIRLQKISSLIDRQKPFQRVTTDNGFASHFETGQYLTVPRSVRYNSARHKTGIGPTKRKKVRTVDFCDTLAEILREARKEQRKNRFKYVELYHRNYYKEVREKNRVYYEYYHLDGTQDIPDGYTEISFVCLWSDGFLELPSTVGIACRSARKKVPELEGFHFHTLRHTYTSYLLSWGAKPKDVQELLRHADVSTTMKIYATLYKGSKAYFCKAAG